MAIDPRKLDWPFPEDEPRPFEAAREDVLALAEDISTLLTGVHAETRDAFIDLSARCWEHTPSPTLSLRHAAHLLNLLERSERAAFARLSVERPVRFRELFALLGHSDLIAGWLTRPRGWRMFFDITDEMLAAPLTRDAVLGEFMLADAAAAERDEAPARLRRRHMAALTRVVYHDRLLGRPLTAVIGEISELADAALEAALLLTRRELIARYGEPVDDAGKPIGFCVLALGKLGGRELNYSSDIDVMFLFGGEGVTRGADDAGARSIAAAHFFARLAEGIMRLLSSRTEDGQPYRVDARLRPDGARGALALSLDAALKYYRTRGATWERQALLKVRAAAGDPALGRRFIEDVRSFVHRRYLSAGAVNEIKALKRRIEHSAAARAQTFRDVKTGFGGIRDIEFVTQFLQLVHGGRHPEVCGANTLDALAALAAHGCLRRAEADELAETYRLLRRIEHGLQLDQGLQTHQLPDNGEALELLARRIGYAVHARSVAAAQLYRDLSRATARARAMLSRLFTGLFSAEHHGDDVADIVLDPLIEEERVAAILGRYRLQDWKRARQALRRMGQEEGAYRHFESRTRTYLASMLPELLRFVAHSPDADMTLSNFERLTASLGVKGVFYELVAEQPEALRVFGALCAYSRLMVELIEARPGLLDEFLDLLRTFGGQSRSALRAQLDARCLAAANVVEGLNWTWALELLRIGLFDASGRSDLRAATRDLATLAEVIVEAATEHALKAEADRAGLDASRRVALSPRFVVIALGKLGGGYLNYASDLDLVFVYDGTADEREHFERVAAEVRRILEAPPTLYRVDLRLRPMGSAGAIAASITGLGHYLSNDARFWERLAATRARVIVNADTDAGRHAARFIRRFVYEQPLPADAVDQALDMRARLEEQGGKDEVKRGYGGLLDAEFALELAQLVEGNRADGLDAADLFDAFAAFEARRDGLGAALAELKAGYAFLRMLENRLQVAYGGAVREIPPEPAARMALARRMGFEGADAVGEFQGTLLRTRRRNRELFKDVLEMVRERMTTERV